ncbi:ATP-binding protein [Caenispirillum bisanense]|uniref:ATP-binding protein n=1 Tax=Caenispirillum bisanense TaxID=414052 RepID=UPI0031DB9BFE
MRDVAILARCEVDEGGAATAIFGVMQDITDRKRAEEDLKVSEERLQRATAFAEIGTWEWTLESGAVYCSDRMAALFGHPGQCVGRTHADLMESVHPADRAAVTAAADACIQGLRAFDVEHRVIWPNGRIHWLHARGDVVRAADGTPVRMLGVVRDITRTKAAELALKESQRRLRVAIENISDGFLLVDSEDRVVLWNEKLKSLYPRLAPHLYVGVPFEDLVRAGVRDGQYANALGREEEFIAERMARHRLDEELYEERLVDALGDERWVRVAERTIPGGGGRVGIRADVTELRRAQQEADTANKAKSEFLSSMSHELRTPLNAILGFAQLLEASRREPLTDKQKSHVQHILKGGQHLLELINEVLDLARIEAGKMSLSIEDISPADVVEECLSLTETLAARRGITVVREAPAQLPAVRADYTRLKQVLLNLLSNAVKYNRDGGRLTLAIGPGAPATMRFSVSDTGRGIPADRQGELFQPFNRLGAETTEVEGTGIGLTLTRELVERMGGAIGFVSEAEVGSTFWVDIPLSEAKDLIPADDGEAAAAEPELAATRSLRVLYIEDNPANMRLMEEVMEEVGEAILSTAHTAELGIEMAIRDRPDLVIMDINLPGMDGYRAIGVLRDTPQTRAIPVIALSANATASAIQKGLAAGFDAYLTKPVVIPELMQAIARAVEDRRG